MNKVQDIIINKENLVWVIAIIILNKNNLMIM